MWRTRRGTLHLQREQLLSKSILFYKKIHNAQYDPKKTWMSRNMWTSTYKAYSIPGVNSSCLNLYYFTSFLSIFKGPLDLRPLSDMTFSLLIQTPLNTFERVSCTPNPWNKGLWIVLLLGLSPWVIASCSVAKWHSDCHEITASSNLDKVFLQQGSFTLPPESLSRMLSL